VNDKQQSSSNRGFRTLGLAGAAVVLAMAGAACSSGTQPTPIYVIKTDAPSASIEATQTAADTTAPTDTPAASVTLLPTLAPTDSPTPVPSTTPAASPSDLPSSGPTSPAAFCTGGAKNQLEYVSSAHTLKFDVYCARLGKGWSLGTWSWSASGTTGLITARYNGPHGVWILVSEGHFTPAADTGNIGSASFGGLSGDLDTTADGFVIKVNAGSAHGYQLEGHGTTQATLVAIGASMKVVPKT
jgi:hypothetical protein